MYIYEYFIFILYAILIIAFQINPICVIFKYTRTILEIILAQHNVLIYKLSVIYSQWFYNYRYCSFVYIIYTYDIITKK